MGSVNHRHWSPATTLTPRLELLSKVAEQTRFIAVYAIDRMVADDEAIRDIEMTYREAVTEIISA